MITVIAIEKRATREGEVISMGTTEMERQGRANDRWTVREVIGDKIKIQW